MGFLHKIWDETLAGPAPENGLGRLRKCSSLSCSRSAAAPPVDVEAPVDDQFRRISRSITIVKNDTRRSNLNVSVGSPSTPSSPTSAPNSPFSPCTPGGNVKKFTRRNFANKASKNQEFERY